MSHIKDAQSYTLMLSFILDGIEVSPLVGEAVCHLGYVVEKCHQCKLYFQIINKCNTVFYIIWFIYISNIKIDRRITISKVKYY